MSKIKRQKYVEPAEESIALRITNALIIVTCIIVACMYAELPLFQTFLYVWFAMTGCYTSYYFRHGKHAWLTGCIVAGLLFVVGLFVHDILQEFHLGHLENFAPFLAVIAGMQTVHAYDLQTRTDINVSTVLSILLFTMTAVIGRDLLFGFFLMALIALGSALLYFEAVARTKSNQGSTQFSQTEITLPFPSQSRRMASGSAVLPIAALPVLTVILFACLPRVDSMLDVLFAKFQPSPIKVDDKGFNFMSGKGKGPGKGTNGSGTGEGPGKGQDKTDANDKTINNSQNNSGQASGNKPAANSPKDGTGTGVSSKDEKDGKVDKGSKADKSARTPGGAAADQNKTGKDGTDGKDGKEKQDQKNGKAGGTGSSSVKDEGKNKDGKSHSDALPGSGESKDGDKKGPSDKGNQNGSNSGSGQGKGHRHGNGVQGGLGDTGEEETNPETQKRLENTELGESDEMVFRNKETAEFDDSVFMKVRSDQPVFLKRAVFDKYDGKHWVATITDKPAVCEKSASGWTELGGVPQLFVPSEQKTTIVQQVITADIGLGRIIPAASVPQRVDLGKTYNGSISVDSYGVLRASKNIEKGTVFKIESKILSFDIKKMHEAERDPVKEKAILAEQAIYMQLPENLPPEIKKLTDEVVIADDNFFNRADRVCKHLRTHFKYSSEVYRGSESEDLVANFLFKKKEGACGEFSSAFVIMCRQAGVPARCVGGYAPGSPDGRTGRREVSGVDGHAWGEVCIPNVGWVPFDATPTGTMPENSVQDQSWFSQIKRAFESAEAAFQSSQEDRNIGKGSEEDYQVAARQQHKSAARPQTNESGTPTPSQTSENIKENRDGTKEGSSAARHKDKAGADAISPMGKSTADAEAEIIQPAEKTTAEKVENKSFTLTWQEIACAIGFIPFAFLIIRFGLARFRRRSQDVRTSQGVTPSTVLYLKMTEDLKRLKILRKPSDTTDELSRRFSELVEIDERIHPELEGLVLDFIDIYAQERFSEEGHNVENYKQLRDIGNRIHSLSKTRLEKQRN